jgi:hypothetical protein
MKKRIRRHRDGYIEEIACGVCGTVIASFGPAATEPFSAREVEPGKVVYVYPGTLLRNNLYREVTLRMSDGGRHVTHLCSRCGLEQVSLDQFQELYEDDLEDLVRSEGMVRETADLLRKRKVVGVER